MKKIYLTISIVGSMALLVFGFLTYGDARSSHYVYKWQYWLNPEKCPICKDAYTPNDFNDKGIESVPRIIDMPLNRWCTDCFVLPRFKK